MRWPRETPLPPEHAQPPGEQRTYNEHAHGSSTNGRGRVVAVLVGWAQRPLCYMAGGMLPFASIAGPIVDESCEQSGSPPPRPGRPPPG